MLPRIYSVPILILSLILLVTSVHGSAIRKVLYHEGVAEDESSSSSSSSSLEDIPPREEWFRVRGAQNQPIVPKYEKDDVIALASTRAAMRDNENTPGALTRTSDPLPGDNGNRQMNVDVRYRGKVGLQNNRGIGHNGNHPREEQIISTKKFGEEVSELSNLPSTSGGNGRENWYMEHLRPEIGRRNTENTEPVISVLSSLPRNDEDYDDENTDDVRSSSISSVPAEAFPINEDGEIDVLSIKPHRDEMEIAEDLSSINPPPHDQVAKMARYIVHNSNWTSMATISTLSAVKGYPFANVFSVSDGPGDNSTGIPYMYLTPIEMSVIDLKKDSRASLTMSLAQSDYCKQQNYDPEDPRCAHVILSGRMARVRNSNETRFAQNSLFSKHPEMKSWPKDHGWFFGKLNIENIIVLDYFGGAKTVSVQDYFNASTL